MRGYAGPDGAVAVVAEENSRSSTKCGEGTVEGLALRTEASPENGKGGKPDGDAYEHLLVDGGVA